jgi:CheY-like chemotaxis protein
MTDDLLSLRMLIVAAVPSQRDLWQKGAAMASVPVEFVTAEDFAGAASVLKKMGADICVIDGALSEDDRAAVADAARRIEPAPLLFASVAPGVKRPTDVDAALARPKNADEACKLVERCVRAKIPTRVLIVDDSNTMRSIVRKILAASRFALDIQEVSQGAAALELLGSGRFDLVFLDYNMPGLNGIETLAQIKRTNSNVSVVIMTSAVSNAVIKRAQEAGALAFLKKPFYPADIDTVLERHFGLQAAPN